METIRIQCPNCSAILEAKDNPANYEKYVTCPNCKVRNKFKDFKHVIPKEREDDSTRIDEFGEESPGCLLDMTTRREYPLKEGRNLVGRKPVSSPAKADIPIVTSDQGMSREHLLVDVMRGRDGHYHVYVSNAKNKNATEVNGEVLEDGDKVGIKHGDIIKLCDTPLKYLGNIIDDDTEL